MRIEPEKLKQTLIALSVVNDMPIPQRLFEIKQLVQDEIWTDQEFCNQVENSAKQILDANNSIVVKLNKIEFYKKIKNDSEMKKDCFTILKILLSKLQ